MELKMRREEFARALGLASVAVAKVHIRPDLKNALLQFAPDGKLLITTTDLEIGVQVSTPCEIVGGQESKIDVCTPCGLLLGLLSECSSDFVHLHAYGEKSKLVSGDDEFDIWGTNPQEYPTAPEVSGSEVWSMDAAALSAMLRHTIPCASTNQGRYALCSVLFEKESDGTLHAVACDGIMLAEQNADCATHNNTDGKYLCDLKTAKELSALLALTTKQYEDEAFTVTLRQANNRALFECPHFSLWTSELQGMFPQWRKVIPTGSSTEISVDRKALLDKIHRCMFTDGEEKSVVLECQENGSALIFSSSAPDKGSSVCVLDCNVEGAAVKATFNPRNIYSMIASLDGSCDTVKIIFEKNDKPLRVDNGSRFTGVIMPKVVKE